MQGLLGHGLAGFLKWESGPFLTSGQSSWAGVIPGSQRWGEARLPEARKHLRIGEQNENIRGKNKFDFRGLLKTTKIGDFHWLMLAFGEWRRSFSCTRTMTLAEVMGSMVEDEALMSWCYGDKDLPVRPLFCVLFL